MNRIKSFATPHKALRNVLGKFSLELGYVNFSDPEQLQALKARGNEMFRLLDDHVHTENEYTLKHLEERSKGSSDHDKEDHVRLEKTQTSLQHQLEGFTGKETADQTHDFYLAFSLFQSEYLEHIHEEESVTELLLQKHFADDELIQHRMAIMKKLEFPLLLLWMKYVIPAQSEAESSGMLSGLQKVLEKDRFTAVLNVIQLEMSAERVKKLLGSIQ
ncbi:MAG: cation-binding protein [Bacteroidetes bacterium]|jgi:hypothetical protein|nr:cation-binding protein [Bacteroidota bacterium]